MSPPSSRSLRAARGVHAQLAAGSAGLTAGGALGALGLGSPGAVADLVLLESPLLAAALLLSVGVVLGVAPQGTKNSLPQTIAGQAAPLGSPSEARAIVGPGVIPGALMVGAGAVLCGALPVVPLVQLVQGDLTATLSLGGIVIGAALAEGLCRWHAGRQDAEGSAPLPG